jgi:hypothetical protein
MKKAKKSENEKWTSTESVISPGFVKSTSETDCVMQVIDEWSSSEVDQEEGR